MPSVSPHSGRLAVFGVCGLLLSNGLAGCSTTQEKAAEHQAEAERILDARAERQKHKNEADGPKASKSRTDSAHRPQEGER